MKTDLARNWVKMAVLPYGPADKFRNKYVACLLGDEIATDKEFREMSESHSDLTSLIPTSGCMFSYNGSCFHPFRTGCIVDAIFADCFGGEANAAPIVNKEALSALENRGCSRCLGCCLKMERVDDDSAFYAVSRFYDVLIEAATSNSLYWGKYEEFVDRHVGTGIDGKKFLDNLPQYEENVRAHFDKMMRRHFKLVMDASEADGGLWNLGDDERRKKSQLPRAILTIRFDLVTHWMSYWIAGKYKEKEAE